MKSNQHHQQEELLKKLTEIHDQLEDLEKKLDSNLSEHRKNLMKDQEARITNFENRIAKLENTYQKGKFQMTDKLKNANITKKQSLKLELGF